MDSKWNKNIFQAIVRMSLPRKLEINELVLTEDEVTQPQSPSLQPCLPHVPQEEISGCDNPVFTLDESQFLIPMIPSSSKDFLPFDNHISSNGKMDAISSPSKHFNNVVYPISDLRRNSLTPLSVPVNLGAPLRSSPVLWTNTSFDSQGIRDALLVPDPTLGSRQSSVISNGSVESLHLQENYNPSTLPAINIDSISHPPTPERPLSVISQHSQSHLSTKLTVIDNSRLWPEKGSQVYRQIHRLVSSLSERAKNIKEKVISQPPTPTSTSSAEKTSSAIDNGDDPKEPRSRLDSFAQIDRSRASSVLPDGLPKPDRYIGCGKCQIKIPRRLRKFHLPDTMDQTSYIYISWLFVVTMCYLYNSYAIFLRFFFSTYQTENNLYMWLIGDYFSDFVYLLDIVLFKPRLRYIQEGLLVDDRRLTMRHYVRKVDFKVDVLALLPLDIFYVVIGTNTMLRIPRILKITSFWEFFDVIDKVAKAPHIPRVLRTLNYMIFLIHINACAYYAFSASENFNTNWTYNKVGDPYIRCFFITFKIATSIGNIDEPTNLDERVFMTINWLLGVFVFALLIGQIRDILSTAGSAKKEQYRKVVDSTIAYLQAQKLPKQLQDKVKMWFSFQWEQAKTINENEALEFLPKKMKTDIAISVHYQTLSKVQLFRDCDKALLRDLVLKLKPVLYLPGDLVCTKGEVGKEMYIVSYGQVQVVGGPNDDIVFATLGEGSVFGEISLLALAGGNRRTANVKSVGFSNLFVLSKADLHETIRDYPQAQAILKKKAKQLIKENAARTKKQSVTAECIVKSREGTPKLIKTVIQVIDPNSKTAQMLMGKHQHSQESTISREKNQDKPNLHSDEIVDNSETKHKQENILLKQLNQDLIEVPRGEEDNDVIIVETSERSLGKGENVVENTMTITQGDGTTDIVQIISKDHLDFHRPLSAGNKRTDSLLSLQIINSQQEVFMSKTKRNSLFIKQSTTPKEFKTSKEKLKKKSFSQDASKSFKNLREELQLQRIKRPSLPPSFHLLRSLPPLEDILSTSASVSKHESSSPIPPPSDNTIECDVTVHRERSPSIVESIDVTEEQTD